MFNSACVQGHDTILQQRRLAVLLDYKHAGNFKAIKSEFVKEFPNHGQKNLSRFVADWAKAFKKRGSVLDELKTGRPPLITDEQAEEAVRVFGVDKYHSVAEAAKKEPVIAHLLENPKVSSRMLLRRMLDVEPELCKCHTPEMKHQLTPQQKELRFDKASEYLHHSDSYVNRMVYMDAKTIIVKQLGKRQRKVYGIIRHPIHQNLLKEAKSWSTSGVTLRWYSGVNAVHGGVFIKFTSGTTGLKTSYKVG